jgi:hypothetical protein
LWKPRAKRKAQADFLEPYTKGMEAIGGLLHQRLLDRTPNWKFGVKANGSAGGGTFFLKTDTSVKVADVAAFHDFVFTNDLRNMLTAHVAKEAVLDYQAEMEKYRETNGGALPPGVTSTLPPGITLEQFAKLQIRKT